jgi:hypothetical protein
MSHSSASGFSQATGRSRRSRTTAHADSWPPNSAASWPSSKIRGSVTQTASRQGKGSVLPAARSANAATSGPIQRMTITVVEGCAIVAASAARPAAISRSTLPALTAKTRISSSGVVVYEAETSFVFRWNAFWRGGALICHSGSAPSSPTGERFEQDRAVRDTSLGVHFGSAGAHWSDSRRMATGAARFATGSCEIRSAIRQATLQQDGIVRLTV